MVHVWGCELVQAVLGAELLQMPANARREVVPQALQGPAADTHLARRAGQPAKLCLHLVRTEVVVGEVAALRRGVEEQRIAPCRAILNDMTRDPC